MLAANNGPADPTTGNRQPLIDFAQVDGREIDREENACAVRQDFALGLVLRVIVSSSPLLHPRRNGLHRVVLSMDILLRGLNGRVAQHLLDHGGWDLQVIRHARSGGLASDVKNEAVIKAIHLPL